MERRIALAIVSSALACSPPETTSPSPPASEPQAATTAAVDGPPDVRDPAAFTEWCRAFAQRSAKSATYTVDPSQPLTLQAASGEQRLTVALDDPWNACQQQPQDCDALAREWVGRVVRTIDASDHEAVALSPAGIRPAIRSSEYVDGMRAQGSKLITEPFVAGLSIVYMLDLPDAARTLEADELAVLKMDRRQLRQRALANVEAEIGKPAKHIKALPENGIGYLTTQSYYNSSLVLLHAEWKSVSERFGGKLLVAIPAPDVLLYADGRGPQARDALAALAAEIAGKSPAPLFTGVLRWTASGWEIVAP
jgi:uncharacterized protein YtpQ (UPF0354 family)